ncbi:Catechol o-methyltransferase, partial [Globisporangium splendens]
MARLVIARCERTWHSWPLSAVQPALALASMPLRAQLTRAAVPRAIASFRKTSSSQRTMSLPAAPPGGWALAWENNSEACLEYVKQNATHGDPASVIAAIDEFATTNPMMNVGINKGKIVDEEIRKKKPTVMAELGGYTGYSAVRFASLQREVAGNNESHYYSFEFSPVFAARVREMVAIAGLSDQVTVIEGAFSEQYQALKGKTVDLTLLSMCTHQIYFIDHEKSVYLSDAKLIVESSTLQPGSLLVADNVLVPGAPDYLEYVESSPLFNTTRHEVQIGRNVALTDAISVATYLG